MKNKKFQWLTVTNVINPERLYCYIQDFYLFELKRDIKLNILLEIIISQF